MNRHRKVGKGPGSPPPAQVGQVIPVALVLLMVGVLIGLVTYNTSRLVSDRANLSNTADSAVYSGLVWQTRVLNFNAYSNRAMVANQVSIAQAVSLRSWSLHSRIAAENMNVVLGAIPYLGQVVAVYQRVVSGVDRIVEPVAEVMAAVIDEVNGVLSIAQELMYYSAFAETPLIVSEIIDRSDDRFEAVGSVSVASLVSNAARWREHSRRYDATDRDLMNERASIINRSLDPFSRKRNWKFMRFWLPLTPLTHVQLHKEGQTRLVIVDDDPQSSAASPLSFEWKAKDNLALNIKKYRLFGKKKREVPIGWGQAVVNTGQSGRAGVGGSIEPGCSTSGVTGAGGECPTWFKWNKKGERMADRRIRSLMGSESFDELNAGYGGIRGFRVLSEEARELRDPRLSLTVAISLDHRQIMTSRAHGINGNFSTTDEAADNRQTSVSKAEIYFDRPGRSIERGLPSRKIEYANLYNPFWDVRLADVDKATRTALWVVKGLHGDGSVIPGFTETGSGQAVTDAPSSAVAGSLQQHAGSSALARYAEDQLVSVSKKHIDSFTDNAVAIAEQAGRSLLSAVAGGGNVTGDIEEVYQTVSDSVSTVADSALSAQTAFESLEDDARWHTGKLKKEFDRVATSVSETFDVEVARIGDDAQALRQELSGRLSDLPDEIASAASEIERAELQALIDAINLHTGALNLSIDEAIAIVRLDGELSENLEQWIRTHCIDTETAGDNCENG